MRPGVIHVRADICADCPTPCAWQHATAHHADPCAACPLPASRWGTWDCGASVSPKPESEAQAALRLTSETQAPGVSPLLRRPRSYRRTGYLVGLLEFFRRRTACAKCDRRRTLPTHPGLYGCGSCSSCTGGPERMVQTTSTCPKKLWPLSPPTSPSTPQTAPGLRP